MSAIVTDPHEKGLTDSTGNNGGVETPPHFESDAVQEEIIISGRKLVLVFTGFLSSVFLVNLDQTIIATALPRIISQFNALSQVSWVASVYFLTESGLMLTASQFLLVIPTKYVYLGMILIFEIGSLLCAVAPSLNFLIFGRAVAGCGASGIIISVIASIAQMTRFEDRPVLFATIGGVFAVASVTGPLIGGGFTQHATWRWCFWINLPLGAISIVLVFLFLDSRPPPVPQHLKPYSRLGRLARLDWIGTFLCFATVVSLLLALQWGGNEKPWNNYSVIISFVFSGVGLLLFVIYEGRLGAQAMFPLDMFQRRTQTGAMLQAFWNMLSFLVGSVYYLPLWYQAKGSSPTKSGLDILPFMISLVVACFVSGAVIKMTGRYWLWLLLSPMVSAIGAGLLYTISDTTSTAKLIGYQILFGAGIGGALQNTYVATQAEYQDDEQRLLQASSVVAFTQLLGGVIGLSIAATIFLNRLTVLLPQYAPDLSPEIAQAVRQSITAISMLPIEQRDQVIRAYIHSLDPVFLVGVGSSIIAALSTLLMKNYDIRERASNPVRTSDSTV